MKRNIMMLTFAVVLACATCSCDYLGSGKATLTMAQKSVAAGAPITVTFTAPSSFRPNAWIGILPSTVPHGSEATNDQFDLSYQYLNKMKSGSLTFTSPNQPGTYDVRMHDTDDNGKEIASVTFTVEGPAAPVASEATIKLDNGVFKSGDQIKVTFTAPAAYKPNAWVGIIPSGIPHGNESVNDEADLTYQYLNSRTSGELTFTAPKPGTYDVRMHDTDDNGREVASASFLVK